MSFLAFSVVSSHGKYRKPKWQKRDSSVSGGEAGKENLVGFGAKISDGINAKNEVVFNLKIKLICGMDGH